MAAAARVAGPALAAYPNLQVQDESEFVGDATEQIDQLVQFFQLLLALSVGIAILGIVNTLALSVLERTRELGLLRAVGMSRRQVKRMVRVESVLVAVFGGLLGLAVGVIFGVGAAEGAGQPGRDGAVVPGHAAGALPAAGRGGGDAGGVAAGPPGGEAQRPAGGRRRLSIGRYGRRAGPATRPGDRAAATVRTVEPSAALMAVRRRVEPRSGGRVLRRTLGLDLADERPFALVARVRGTMLRITEVPSVAPAPYTVLGFEVRTWPPRSTG